MSSPRATASTEATRSRMAKGRLRTALTPIRRARAITSGVRSATSRRGCRLGSRSRAVASSCGRLFDAVAAALGLCPDVALFEGQAAMELEDLIDDKARAAALAAGIYRFADEKQPANDLRILEPRPMWQALLEDLRVGTALPVISAKFHLGLAASVADMAALLAREAGEQTDRIDTVVLSGGCFQNKVLFEACVTRLEENGLTCLSQSQVPANDGGLSLGQGAVAAAREIASRSTN